MKNADYRKVSQTISIVDFPEYIQGAEHKAMSKVHRFSSGSLVGSVNRLFGRSWYSVVSKREVTRRWT